MSAGRTLPIILYDIQYEVTEIRDTLDDFLEEVGYEATARELGYTLSKLKRVLDLAGPDVERLPTMRLDVMLSYHGTPLSIQECAELLSSVFTRIIVHVFSNALDHVIPQHVPALLSQISDVGNVLYRIWLAVFNMVPGMQLEFRNAVSPVVIDFLRHCKLFPFLPLVL